MVRGLSNWSRQNGALRRFLLGKQQNDLQYCRNPIQLLYRSKEMGAVEDWVSSVGLVEINHVTNVCWFSTQLAIGLEFMVMAARSHRYINPDEIPLENTISFSYLFFQALVRVRYMVHFSATYLSPLTNDGNGQIEILPLSFTACVLIFFFFYLQ